MKKKDCFKLGLRNLVLYSKVYLNLFIVFSIFCFLFLSLLNYQFVIEYSLEQFNLQYASKTKIGVHISSNYINQDLINKLKNIPGVSGIQITTIDSKEDKNLKNRKNLLIEDTYLEIEGQKFEGKKMEELTFDYSHFSKKDIGLTPEILIKSTLGDSISVSEWIECKEQTKNYFLLGELPTKTKELVVSDYFLNRYGIYSEEFSSILGKTLQLKDEEGNIIESNMILTGIVSKEIFNVKGQTELSRETSQAILMTDKISDDSDQVSIDIFVKDIAILHSVIETVQMNFNSSIFYDEFYMKKIEGVLVQKYILENIIQLVFLILGIVCISYIINVYLYYFNERKGYIGIIRAFGTSFSTIRLLFIVELSITFIISLFMGGICSIIAISFFTDIIFQYIQIPYNFSIQIIGKSFFRVWIISESMIILFVYNMIDRIKKKAIRELIY